MIKEITAHEFDRYAINHALGSYHQSSNYASLMTKYGYERIYLAYYNKTGDIEGATMLLIKKIKHFFKYAYAPKGFLINYSNSKLVSKFTKEIKSYAKTKHIIFIKINPEIATYVYDKKFNKHELSNHKIIDTLIDNGYIKLKDNIYFESILPRFNAVLNLKDYDIKKIDPTNRNRINSSRRKGLEIETTDKNRIKDIYPLFENKKRRRNLNYYKNYFQIFKENLDADIFLVTLNNEKYLKNSKDVFEKEQERNKKLTDLLFKKNTEENLKKKMASDNLLTVYKNDIINATYNVTDKNEIIAGAFCIRFKNHVHIVISGFNSLYSYLNPNYFLHNEIIEYYKDNYDYLDLNGITGDFTSSNPYRGLNEFKLGFKPNIYEFIGEFDLVINKHLYDFLLTIGLLQKEFKKGKND